MTFKQKVCTALLVTTVSFLSISKSVLKKHDLRSNQSELCQKNANDSKNITLNLDHAEILGVAAIAAGAAGSTGTSAAAGGCSLAWASYGAYFAIAGGPVGLALWGTVF